MNIIVNTPDPVPAPPTTYDIVGLTLPQLGALATVLCSVGGAPRDDNGRTTARGFLTEELLEAIRWATGDERMGLSGHDGSHQIPSRQYAAISGYIKLDGWFSPDGVVYADQSALLADAYRRIR